MQTCNIAKNNNIILLYKPFCFAIKIEMLDCLFDAFSWYLGF